MLELHPTPPLPLKREQLMSTHFKVIRNRSDTVNVHFYRMLRFAVNKNTCSCSLKDFRDFHSNQNDFNILNSDYLLTIVHTTYLKIFTYVCSCTCDQLMWSTNLGRNKSGSPVIQTDLKVLVFNVKSWKIFPYSLMEELMTYI